MNSCERWNTSIKKSLVKVNCGYLQCLNFVFAVLEYKSDVCWTDCFSVPFMCSTESTGKHVALFFYKQAVLTKKKMLCH
jgi:hypothetical protein